MNLFKNYTGNTMKKLTLLLTMLFTSLSSQATLLSIDLNQDSYQVGDTLTADIVISDIEDYSDASQRLLASFEFDLSWNDTLIEYSSFTFGDKLNVGFLGSDQDSDVMSNSLGLTEISYDFFGSDLFAAQDGLSSFVLASIDFKVIGDDIGVLRLSRVLLGDVYGISLPNITVESPVDVPEPASILLILMALTLLIKQRKVS